MSTSKDISGHKMCPLGVKFVSSIRKFHFSSSAYTASVCHSNLILQKSCNGHNLYKVIRGLLLQLVYRSSSVYLLGRIE